MAQAGRVTRRALLTAAAIAPAAAPLTAAAVGRDGMIQIWVRADVWARFLALAGTLRNLG